MHPKDEAILNLLARSIESGKLSEDFPPSFKGCFYAFALGLKYAQQNPKGGPYPNIRQIELVQAMDSWSDSSLLSFIQKKGDSFPQLVHDALLEKISSTASLGANAVLYLTDKEVSLSKRMNRQPREDLVVRYISTYGGRISLISDLTAILKQSFPASDRIDEALSRHVPVHQIGDRSFNMVARSSDLFNAVPGYRKTLKAHLKCLHEHGSEHVAQYFMDAALGAVQQDIIDIHVDVLGHSATLELAGSALARAYRGALPGAGESFLRFVKVFGINELLNTEAMRNDFELDEIAKRPSCFIKWYARNVTTDIAELTDMAIPLAASMIVDDGVLPCQAFMGAWIKARDPSEFLADFLAALANRMARTGYVGAADKKFQELANHGLRNKDGSLEISVRSLVHAAYGSVGFNELAISIKAAISTAGFQALSRVLPDPTSQSLRGFALYSDPKDHSDLMSAYPKSGEFVMGVDLGL